MYEKVYKKEYSSGGNMKKLVGIMVMVALLLTACGESTDPTKVSTIENKTTEVTTVEEVQETTTAGVQKEEGYVVKEAAQIHYKANGFLAYRFKEPLAEEFVEDITSIYLRPSPVVKKGEIPAPPTTSDKIDLAKCTTSPIKLIMDSDLIVVAPESVETYEVTLETSKGKQAIYLFDIANLRPNTFTIRVIGKDGNVKKAKIFTYDEMLAMATEKAHYSGGCVMHGLFNFKAEGIYLTDLFKAADVTFTEGMSFACRVVDAPTKIKVTERNSNVKTGEIFNNPNRYWMKPRYTDNYKHTYENIYGRERYFVTSQWEDEEIGNILEQDGSSYSISARSAIASKPEYLQKVEPMIAVKSIELQYHKDPTDIRIYENPKYDLFAEEIGFRLLFGVAFDDDPTTNVTAYDKEKKEYPVVSNSEFEGQIAIEEGPDACGTSARFAKYLFGIDVFVEE